MNDAEPTAVPLRQAADARLEQMLADIRRLVEVESPSSDYEAVARGAAEVAQLAAERLDLKTDGVTAETLTDEGVTHVRIRFGSSDPRVLLVNHQDTVWPIGTLARKPFAHEDGVLRGPGVFDMLTGVVMSIHAAALLQEADEDLTGLSIVVTGDEEVGSATGRRLLLDEGRSARAAFVMEGAIGERGDLKIARKGTADWQVHVHGRAAHAGLDPEKGINAGIALGQLLPHIEALGDPQAGTTVTPTIISAGTTTNTVPDLATVAVDGRATSVAEQERTDQQIRALTSPVEGTRVEVTGGIRKPPMERAAGEQLFRQAEKLAGELGIDVPAGREVGGASDGNYTAAAGIPTLDGLGAVGDGAHAEHEHALSAYIAPRTALLAALIRANL
ncbi:M20 family metallopeptidase [Nesterenkonia sp. NBAIMH1]|uniref:M20 family metallopeptidase n=1 Tax=Nesterenkonia sp. NBAIMH1 TaxID=2600320 RepID=UPI0011B41528|nr:M20 family metallopeptidase [Nesterenkonia sp. NBAIMH1]